VNVKKSIESIILNFKKSSPIKSPGITAGAFYYIWSWRKIDRSISGRMNDYLKKFCYYSVNQNCTESG